MYIVIIGCGRVGAELAKLLTTEANDVVVIDSKEGAFSRLGEAFNGITIRGNGVSPRALQEAGIEKADVFCALTNFDNVNIMASQVAKGIFKVPRVIARIYDPRKASIYHSLGLDVLNETTLFASMVRDKIADRMLSSYLLETGDLGMLEFLIPARFVHKTAEEINIPGDLLLTTIKRSDEKPLIPERTTILKKDDSLVAVIKMKSLEKIKRLLNL